MIVSVSLSVNIGKSHLFCSHCNQGFKQGKVLFVPGGKPPINGFLALRALVLWLSHNPAWVLPGQTA
jgi:hypothetical protein